jgi:hypothetical protein
MMAVADRTDIVCSGLSAKEIAGNETPTDDEVPTTADGRRLDTVEKVIAFLDEIHAERAARAADGG